MPKWSCSPTLRLARPLRSEYQSIAFPQRSNRRFSTSRSVFLPESSSAPSSRATRPAQAKQPGLLNAKLVRAAAAGAKVQRLGGIVKSAGGGFGGLVAPSGDKPPPGVKFARRITPVPRVSRGSSGSGSTRPGLRTAGRLPSSTGGRQRWLSRADAASSARRPVNDDRTAVSAPDGEFDEEWDEGWDEFLDKYWDEELDELRTTPDDERYRGKLFEILAKRKEQKPYLPKDKDGHVYNPLEAGLEKEDLINNHIATMLNPRTQMSDAIARLARRPDVRWVLDASVARRLSRGNLVRFKDEEEKARILALAEKFAEQTAAKISAKKKKVVRKMDVGFEPVAGDQKKKLVDRVLEGKYDLHQLGSETKQSLKEKAVGSIRTALQLNGGWDPTSQREFIDMFESLWSAPSATRGTARPSIAK